MSRLDSNAIQSALQGSIFGNGVHVFDAVSSTNETAVGLARRRAPEGTVVLANLQVAGQGRRGKRWFSPPDVNLYCSVILRPTISPDSAPLFTFIASIALVDTLELYGVRAGIKWPNDIVIRRRKLAGVLTEAVTLGDHLEAIILGAGVNLNVSRSALVAALGPEAGLATTLQEVTGTPVDRTEFAIAFLRQLAEWYEHFLRRGKAAVLKAWADRDIDPARGGPKGRR